MMPPETTPPEWVDTIQDEIADEALHLLENVIHQFDLGKTGVIRISGYAHDSPDRLPIGNEGHWRDKRTQVGRMLVVRGVLRTAEARYVGGSPYVGDGDRGDMLFVEGDETRIRGIAKALRGRLHQERPAPRQATSAPAVPAVGTQNYYGPVTNVTTTGDNATVNVDVSAHALEAVAGLVRRLVAEGDKAGLGAEDTAQLRREVATLEAETKQAKPDKGRLRKGVEMVLGTLGKAGAAMASKELIHLGVEVLKHLAV